MNKHPRSDHQKGIKFDSEFVERSSSHYQPGIKFKHPRHEVRYWPMFRFPEANEKSFSSWFPVRLLPFALGLWILIAYLLS